MLGEDNRQIIKIMHQPIAPYVTESYNPLIQLIVFRTIDTGDYSVQAPRL